MKRTLTRAATALACSLGFAQTAGAIPIHFDFTGTITGVEGVAGAAVGTAISGGFSFETDRLESRFDPGSGLYSWLDWEPVGLTEPYAFLNFGGREVAYPSVAPGNYAIINFSDTCRPVCEPFGAENFNMYASSGHSALPDFTGIIQHSAFYFASTALTRLPDPPFIETFNYFDGAQIDATSVVTLPLYDLAGFYSEGTMDCVLGGCMNVDPRSLSFRIDTVTRGVGARAVPEPDTLGLLGAAGLGLLLFGRRRALKPRRLLAASNSLQCTCFSEFRKQQL